MRFSPLDFTRVLGGVVTGSRSCSVPSPGHPPNDRGLSIRCVDTSERGYICFSHNGHPAEQCLAYIDAAMGISDRQPERPFERVNSARRPETDTENNRIAAALRIWNEAVDPRGTPVQMYLARRGLGLPDAALRWHPACPFGKVRATCMVALVTDIRTNRPLGIHRTFVLPDGRKGESEGHSRLTLGPIAGGGIKLTPDEEVTRSIAIGEGIESVLSLRRLPGLERLAVWSLIAANQVAAFPVLSGIETLWVAVDQDPAGLAAVSAAAARWRAADREVVQVRPMRHGEDVNDVVRGRHGD